MLVRVKKEGLSATMRLVALAMAAWALVPSGSMVAVDGAAGSLRIVPCTDGHHGAAGHPCAGFCPTGLPNLAAFGLLGLALISRLRRPFKDNSGIPLRGSTRIYRTAPAAQWRRTA